MPSIFAFFLALSISSESIDNKKLSHPPNSTKYTLLEFSKWYNSSVKGVVKTGIPAVK